MLDSNRFQKDDAGLVIQPCYFDRSDVSGLGTIPQLSLLIRSRRPMDEFWSTNDLTHFMKLCFYFDFIGLWYPIYLMVDQVGFILTHFGCIEWLLI